MSEISAVGMCIFTLGSVLPTKKILLAGKDKHMVDALSRKQGAAYVVTTWKELLENEKVIVTARVFPHRNAPPYTISIGKKLTLAVVEPGSDETKRSAKCLHDAHLGTPMHTSKGRVYIGLSNYAVPNSTSGDQAQHVAKNVHWPTEEQLLPVGTADPMNTSADYKHMQPSLTAAQGRAFGDMATPLWIDAWQSDTIGIVPDPTYKTWNPMASRWDLTPIVTPAKISFLFYKFNEDVELQRILALPADDPERAPFGENKQVVLKIYMEYLYTPDTTWSS
jgi:hypothetical protein